MSSHHPPAEIRPIDAALPVPAIFTKVDNALTGIGFFTASSKRSRAATKKETVVTDRGIEYRISILPSAEYGLPITQDQDYWLALMQLVSDYVQQNQNGEPAAGQGRDYRDAAFEATGQGAQRAGKLTNPFAFSTAELRRVLGQARSGKNYLAVQEWCDVMVSTTIKGGAYNAIKKRWLLDRVHAVERIVTAGKELPDGRIADKHYIWFSQWQLDNINAGHLISIDLSAYTKLENNIAKNLVPHLQEWLFATQHQGRFEKQYEDVCQLLGISVYQYRSRIEQQFRPSLEELTKLGYLSKWALEPMAGGNGYKLVLYHGTKYHADRRAQIERKERRPRQLRLKLPPGTRPLGEAPETSSVNLVAELVKRGIAESGARTLLAGLQPDQPVMDQIEYTDHVISRARKPIDNPPGLYISRLRENAPVPSGFISPRQVKDMEEASRAKAEARRQQQQSEMQAEADARTKDRQLLDARINAFSESERQMLFAEACADILKEHPNFAGHFDYLKTHPEERFDSGILRSRVKEMLDSGWQPKPSTKKKK